MSVAEIVSQVQTMHSQGLDNNQIIQSLQRSGYSSSEIFEALNQVSQGPNSPSVSSPDDPDARGPVSDPGIPDMADHSAQPTEFTPAMSADSPPPSPAPVPQPAPEPSPAPFPEHADHRVPAPSPNPFPAANRESVEEMVEAVIDEKWNELVKDITTIIEWKNNAQNTISTLEQQFVDLKDQFDKLHQALISKIGEYDKNILDVGAEVKAMEKVFSKVLPVFTDNVAQLTKISKDMKKK